VIGSPRGAGGRIVYRPASRLDGSRGRLRERFVWEKGDCGTGGKETAWEDAVLEDEHIYNLHIYTQTHDTVFADIARAWESGLEEGKLPYRAHTAHYRRYNPEALALRPSIPLLVTPTATATTTTAAPV
jgi:hypothetical protein